MSVRLHLKDKAASWTAAKARATAARAATRGIWAVLDASGLFAMTLGIDDKGINVALETILEFDGKERAADIHYINKMQHFLKNVESTIEKRNKKPVLRSRRKKKHNKVKKDSAEDLLPAVVNSTALNFTDFFIHLVGVLRSFDKREVFLVFKTIEDEIKKRHDKECKIHELLENPTIRRSINNGLQTLKESPMQIIQEIVDEFSRHSDESDPYDMKNEVNRWSGKFFGWLKKFYTNNEPSPDQFYEIINDLDSYSNNKQLLREGQNQILQEQNDMQGLQDAATLVEIVKRALRSLFFDQYSNLEPSKRKVVQIQLQSYWVDGDNKTMAQELLFKPVVEDTHGDVHKADNNYANDKEDSEDEDEDDSESDSEETTTISNTRKKTKKTKAPKKKKIKKTTNGLEGRIHIPTEPTGRLMRSTKKSSHKSGKSAHGDKKKDDDKKAKKSKRNKKKSKKSGKPTKNKDSSTSESDKPEKGKKDKKKKESKKKEKTTKKTNKISKEKKNKPESKEKKQKQDSEERRTSKAINLLDSIRNLLAFKPKSAEVKNPAENKKLGEINAHSDESSGSSDWKESLAKNIQKKRKERKQKRTKKRFNITNREDNNKRFNFDLRRTEGLKKIDHEVGTTIGWKVEVIEEHTATIDIKKTPAASEELIRFPKTKIKTNAQARQALHTNGNKNSNPVDKTKDMNTEPRLTKEEMRVMNLLAEIGKNDDTLNTDIANVANSNNKKKTADVKKKGNNNKELDNIPEDIKVALSAESQALFNAVADLGRTRRKENQANSSNVDIENYFKSVLENSTSEWII